MNNHFKIIIPLYNVEKYIKICIRSVKAQTYDNFQCIILDDMSTDDSAAVIRKEIGNDDRFKLIVNTEKAYALKNIYDGINISNPSAEDIILTLDGDDWLASRDVLEKVNNVYNQSGCWLTYGSYAEYPSNRRGKFARQIPLSVINSNSFRNHEWCSSHMRTFKYHLWRQIKKEDLLDSEGKFYSMTWDLAFMFPMLEMAGHRSQYIQDILYVYNVANPLNDHKIDNSYQIKLEREIRNKPSYEKLKTVYCHLKGGLANMMFQIAATTSIAKDNNMVASFPNLYEQLDYLNKEEKYNPKLNHAAEYAEIFGNLNVSHPLGNEPVITFPFHYEKMDLPNSDVIINGFFQSEKYFKKHKKEIFKIPPKIKDKIEQKYSQYLNMNCLSIHVRRGDYLNYPDHHPPLPVEYYEKAMNSLPETDFYLVFGDDIDWCKENFTGDKFIFIENEKDYIELYLMSMCNNHIIANSSFSWWGAWLSDNIEKMVVAPKKWFGNKIKENSDDIIPEGWLKI